MVPRSIDDFGAIESIIYSSVQISIVISHISRCRVQNFLEAGCRRKTERPSTGECGERNWTPRPTFTLPIWFCSSRSYGHRHAKTLLIRTSTRPPCTSADARTPTRSPDPDSPQEHYHLGVLPSQTEVGRGRQYESAHEAESPLHGERASVFSCSVPAVCGRASGGGRLSWGLEKAMTMATVPAYVLCDELWLGEWASTVADASPLIKPQTKSDGGVRFSTRAGCRST